MSQAFDFRDAVGYEFNEYSHKETAYDCRYVDIYGNPNERTPRNAPYSYDPYVVKKAARCTPTLDSAVYSDRLSQWDRDKYEAACKHAFKTGGQFSTKSLDEISDFLSYYFDKKVECTCMMEGCNVATGYPYWIFCYKEI